MIAAAALALLALAAGAATAWHFSSAVLVPDHSPWPAETTVEALPPGRVVLERSEETRRPGIWGLEWPGGRAIAGPVLSEDEAGDPRRQRRALHELADDRAAHRVADQD